MLYSLHPSLKGRDPYYSPYLSGDAWDSAIRPAYVTAGNRVQKAVAAPMTVDADRYRRDDCLLFGLEAAGQEPVLVYYNYKHDLERIKARFPQAQTLDTGDDIRAWNDGEIPLLLCHPASVAYGLNMQEGGHIIVWFGPTWSLELYQQANARLLRQGQTDTVFIHHILTEGTLDLRVVQSLEKKDGAQEALLNALKGYLKENI